VSERGHHADRGNDAAPVLYAIAVRHRKLAGRLAREDTQARSARADTSPRADEPYPVSLADVTCMLSSMIWICRSLMRRAYAS
jgi:hypothetical protein